MDENNEVWYKDDTLYIRPFDDVEVEFDSSLSQEEINRLLEKWAPLLDKLWNDREANL